MHTGLRTSTGAALMVAPLVVCNPARAVAPIEPDHFVGTTPCDTQPRRFLGIVNDLPCERISWRLALSRDRETGRPATFSLVAVYGMQMQSAPGFVDGGTTVQLHGARSVVTGIATNGDAVYRLTTQGPAGSADFAKIGGNLLHLLNEGNRLAIGNPSWQLGDASDRHPWCDGQGQGESANSVQSEGTARRSSRASSDARP